MESGVRKILPRVQPSGSELEGDAVGESLRNGNGVIEVVRPEQPTAWHQTMEDERVPKRKRHHMVDENSPRSQTLPSLRQLLPVSSHPQLLDHERAGPVRLIRTGKGTYGQQGAFKFLAPRPNRDFPISICGDPRELSFAQVEPELMEVFKHAWYLRHYIRAKVLSGEHWNDHIYCNDVYGIDNILHTWICRYEPGNLQYPASILYKQCLWIFFNRSIQISASTAAFRHMVDDGLHFLRTFENELGPNGDRSVLLVPIFLLGSTSFYAGQRAEIWTSLDRLDPSYSIDAVHHAARSLERIWEMMDDGRPHMTWNWEKFQAHDYTMAQADRSLIELLWDPLAPPPQARVRSPETYDFDPSRFRAAPPTYVPPPPPQPSKSQPQEAEAYSPPEARSPRRHQSTASVDADSIRMDANQDNSMSHVEIAAGPRPFLAPPPPSQNIHTNDIIQVLHRKSAKSKSTVPPCPNCGKELKNPSDAQKHRLQHSKPFRCREPGCTRTQGFATENDLQRHRKSVHGASPRIGNKIGYICAACPDPSDGTIRKWWPRLDNFKAHIRRKHIDADEEALINASASARRPEDVYSESGYQSSAMHTPDERRHPQNLRSSRSVEQGTPQGQSVSPPTKGNDNEDTGPSESNPTQGEGDNSDEQDRTPKSESSLSTADPMEVSPTGERGERDDRDD